MNTDEKTLEKLADKITLYLASAWGLSLSNGDNYRVLGNDSAGIYNILAEFVNS